MISKIALLIMVHFVITQLIITHGVIYIPTKVIIPVLQKMDIIVLIL
jgi:hypothetical protein